MLDLRNDVLFKVPPDKRLSGTAHFGAVVQAIHVGQPIERQLSGDLRTEPPHDRTSLSSVDDERRDVERIVVGRS